MHTVGMTVAGVKHIVHRGNTPSTSTPATQSTPTVFDNFAIRRYIHRKFTDKLPLTLNTLATPEQTSQAAFWRLIHTMVFKYKASQCSLYIRKKSQDVVSRRINTLKAFQRYRNKNTQGTKIRDMVHHHNGTYPGVGRYHKAGQNFHLKMPGTPWRRGAQSRLLCHQMIAGGALDGFVERSCLCYPAKFFQSVYHGEMNGDLFKIWLTTHLRQSLQEPFELVHDNATKTFNWLRRVDVLPLHQESWPRKMALAPQHSHPTWCHRQ